MYEPERDGEREAHEKGRERGAREARGGHAQRRDGEPSRGRVRVDGRKLEAHAAQLALLVPRVPAGRGQTTVRLDRESASSYIALYKKRNQKKKPKENAQGFRNSGARTRATARGTTRERVESSRSTGTARRARDLGTRFAKGTL